MEYEPGTPSFKLNEIALGIRRSLEFTEWVAKREKLPLENLEVQFPAGLKYRQLSAWAKTVEETRDVLTGWKYSPNSNA
jgi:hypothetical protein